MPKQDTLGGKKGTVKNPSTTPERITPTREPQVITGKDIATINASDLIESNPNDIKTLAKEAKTVKLPGFLQNVENPELSDRQLTGYVGFAHPMSKNWMSQVAAGCEQGQPYLNHEGRFIALKQVEFFLLVGRSFMTLMHGKDGKFLYVTEDMEETQVTCDSTTNGGTLLNNLTPYVPDGATVKLEPHYVVLMLVNINNSQLVPIKGDFRGTKSGGMEQAFRAIEAAGTPEWEKLSDSHKATLAFPQPFGRVYHIIRSKPGVSKSTGNDFHSTICHSQPSNITQMQLLVDRFGDDDFKKKLDAAYVNFNSRVTFLEKIMNEGFEE
jgi:hypothetical protein